MKNLKLFAAVMVLSCISNLGSAQIQRRELKLPTIDGYQLLRCDFHIHTVFSDGMVWPTIRVDEALVEGLDAIAITDHIEYRPKLKEFTSKDHNHSFDITSKYAEERGIILIRGAEVTRQMAPGHFNAIFIEDANRFEKYANPNDSHEGTNIVATLEDANSQGAFVFWNHPWYQHKENRSEWQAIHEELYQKKLISGVEVVNSYRYDPLVLQWCLDKNLTVMANSDIHITRGLENLEFRTMTLVFAKERSAAGIKEALVNHRTVAYFDAHIYGKEELVKQIVANSIQIKANKIGTKSGFLEITNISSIPFDMTVLSNDGIVLKLRADLNNFTAYRNSTTLIPIEIKNLNGNKASFTVTVNNAQIGANKPLTITMPVEF